MKNHYVKLKDLHDIDVKIYESVNHLLWYSNRQGGSGVQLPCYFSSSHVHVNFIAMGW